MSKKTKREVPTYSIDYIVGYTYLDGTPVVKSLGPIYPRCGPGQVDIQWVPDKDGKPYGAPLELMPIVERKVYRQTAYVPGSGNPGGH
ncbi:MAG: hypothetical protein WAV41_03415 [Microgenomates group bacterium]